MGGAHSYQPRDLAGQVVIITGGNAGIGFETALALCKIHAHVIITCRNDAKGTETVNKIKEKFPEANIEYMLLELASLNSVRTFVENFKAKNLPLNILINNAGIMNTSFGLTEDGIEQQFAVNHLAHFLLTMLLLDKLKESTPSKIINLSSSAHRWGDANYDDLKNTEPGNYSGWDVYGRSKMANILFTYALARRLPGKVTVNAVHPGVVRTELNRHLDRADSNSNDNTRTKLLNFLYAHSFASKSPYEGALTTLTVAADPVSDTVTGKYWVDNKVTSSNSFSQNVANQEKLWEVSLKLTGIEDPTIPEEAKKGPIIVDD